MLELDPNYLKIVEDILENHAKNKTVWAYGSRVKGTSHAGSDLDLVILNANKDQTPILKEAFRESNLPILVDVFDWTEIPVEFKKEIEKNHIVLQEAEE